jgi:hypothetical protein
MDSESSTAEPSKVLPPSTDRLSLPIPIRLPLSITIGSISGFTLGAAHGSRETGLRFRAENAHRLPNTQTGWYLYHKSKNYNVILGGLYEGWKMSVRLGWWAGVFVGLEEGVDRGRAALRRSWVEHVHPERLDGGDEKLMVERDFVSTVLSGLGTAGAFSAWNHFPLPTAVRVMKMGAKAGLGFGVLQDAVSLLRGRRLGYVDFIKRHTLGTDDRGVMEEVEAGAG